MARKSLSAIVLNRSKRASLQSQLAGALKTAIRGGSIRSGEAVPGSRELATDLKVSRNTVLIAYDQLVSEGYLDSRPRSGLFVAEALAGQTQAPAARDRPAGSGFRSTPSRPIGPQPFRPCQPDVRLFPLASWNR